MPGFSVLVLALFALCGYASAGYTYTVHNVTAPSYPPWPSFSPSIYVVIKLPTASYCGGCPYSTSCCHVGTWYAPSYQCLTVSVTYTTPLVVKPVLPKPKPVYKAAPVIPVSYCKCGAGYACCQVKKAYKCVSVYKPKPIKCGWSSCKAGYYCSKSKWYKRSKCTTWYYPYKY